MKPFLFKDYVRRRRINLDKFFSRYDSYASMAHDLRAKGVVPPLEDEVKDRFIVTPSAAPVLDDPVPIDAISTPKRKVSAAGKKRKPRAKKAKPAKKSAKK